MLLSLYFPTACSISPTRNPKSNSSSSSTRPSLYVKFHSKHREDLRYLKTIGVVDPNLHKTPSPDTLDQILFTVDFLKSKGFSDSDFSRLAFLCPQLFSPNFDPTDIQPVFDFLSIELAATVEESRSLIFRCPGILFSDVEYCLSPTLNYLKGLGVEKLNSPTTLNAHLLNTRVVKFEEKIRFLRRAGFSYEEAARVCGRFPAIFGYSIENNLRPKFEYLVWGMKRSVEELKEFPQYFAFSLKKRIAPRHLHLERRGVQVPLKRMLLWGDDKFYAKWK